MTATLGYLTLGIRRACEHYRHARGGRHPGQTLRFVGVVLLTVLVSQTARAADLILITRPSGQVVVRDEVFGNEAAARKVVEARSYDPMFCREDQRSRDKAIALYAEAISLQPNTPINAELADRIAQMYAFYEDRKNGVWPEPAKAAEWWQRASTMVDRHQLLWLQLQMGLASAHVMDRDPVPAIEACKRIIAINPDELQLPPSKISMSRKLSPSLQPKWEQSELQKVRSRGASIRLKAVDQLAIACNRLGREAKAAVLDDIAAKYRGTPVGDIAHSLRPQLANGIDMSNEGMAVFATPSPAQSQPTTRPLVMADGGSRRAWLWGVVAVCMGALCTWVIVCHRRKGRK